MKQKLWLWSGEYDRVLNEETKNTMTRKIVGFKLKMEISGKWDSHGRCEDSAMRP
jgi:hypothetical protein